MVGYDARRMSREFAEDTAAVLAARRDHRALFGDVVPTPLVSFAVTHLGAAVGIMVTASHNPADDNGYKVYWSNGVQLVPAPRPGVADRDRRGARGQRGASRARFAADRRGPGGSRGELPAGVQSWLPPEAGARRFGSSIRRSMGSVFGWLSARCSAPGFAELIAGARASSPDPRFPTVSFPNPEEPGVLIALVDSGAASTPIR